MSCHTKGHPAIVTLACDAEAVVASKPPAGVGIRASSIDLVANYTHATGNIKLVELAEENKEIKSNEIVMKSTDGKSGVITCPKENLDPNKKLQENLRKCKWRQEKGAKKKD